MDEQVARALKAFCEAWERTPEYLKPNQGLDIYTKANALVSAEKRAREQAE